MWNESNNYSPKRICSVCNKKEGIHEVNFDVYLCHSCFAKRNSDQMARHINWAGRETVDTLMEAVYYFNYTKRNEPYTSMYIREAIRGDRGIVCYVIDQNFSAIDAFQTLWEKHYRYFLLYNRRYLAHGDSLFERASMYKGDWQTVRKDILEKATSLNNTRGSEYRDHVAIVIVMQNKAIWFVNPSLMTIFSYEYETERIPYNESAAECSIPISKDKIISRHDPFSPESKSTKI